MSRVEPVPQAIRSLILGEPLPPMLASADVEAALDLGVSGLLLQQARAEEVSLPTEDLFRIAALSLRFERIRADAEAGIAFVAELADRASCEFAVFKGLANAALLYRDVSARPFNDVDIVVGLTGTGGLAEFLSGLGHDPAAASALISLAMQGDPIYEVHIASQGVNIDLHFNPFGLLAPPRAPLQIAAELSREIEVLGRTIPVPSPELSLLIASINLVRKGGGAMWLVADCVRLVQGRAGDLDWDRFLRLAEAEGLRPLTEQVMLLLRDLGADVPAFATANSTTWWGPKVGEGSSANSLGRHTKFALFHRRPVRVRESLLSLYRWYLPDAERRLARSLTGTALSHASASRRRLLERG